MTFCPFGLDLMKWYFPLGLTDSEMALAVAHHGSNYYFFCHHNPTQLLLFGYFRPFKRLLMVPFLFLPLVEKYGQWLPNCGLPCRDTGNG